MFLKIGRQTRYKLRGGAGNCGILRYLSSLPVSIKQLLQNPPEIGTKVNVNGHIKSVRKFKKVGFIDISDGTCGTSLPVVFHPSLLDTHALKVGQSLAITGDIKESKGVQEFEISLDVSDEHHKVQIIGDVTDAYPIQKKEMTLPYLRSQPILRHRTSTLSSILRVRSFLERQLMDFFDSHSFTKVTPPMITSADCEGAGEQFVINPLNTKEHVVNGKVVEKEFFGKPVYLTVSTQLHLEVLAPSLNRVWTLTPCFRAEDSNTNRHLSEFWMLEAEMCYIDEISQLTQFTESMIKHATEKMAAKKEEIFKSRFNKDDHALLEHRWNSVLTISNWPSLTYTEAIALINANKPDSFLKWGDSISTEDEKWLAGDHFKSPVFVTDYPKDQKPFYMPPSKHVQESGLTVACFDLIFPEIGELIGGSLREHRYDKLVEEMTQRGMNAEEMKWYLETRQNGTVPHGGFGMGFERLIVYLTGLDNLKDIVTFVRAPDQCEA